MILSGSSLYKYKGYLSDRYIMKRWTKYARYFTGPHVEDRKIQYIGTTYNYVRYCGKNDTYLFKYNWNQKIECI
jgi:hypothetical protein